MKVLLRILAVVSLLSFSYIGASLSAPSELDFAESVQAAPKTTAASLAGDHNSAVVNTLMKVTLLGSEWVLWLLLLLSVATGAVIFERISYFRKDKIDFDGFMSELTNFLKHDDTDAALIHSRHYDAFEARVAYEAFSSEELGLDAVEKSISGYIARQRTVMDKGLMFLGTLGNNAPFIGLFGTVLGIIQAFHGLSFNPAGGPSVVMAGISEALIATAVGLFVAIPAVIAFNWFQRIVGQKLSNAEAIQDLILKHYAGVEARKSKAA